MNEAFVKGFIGPFGTWFKPLLHVIKSPYFEELVGIINHKYQVEDVSPNKKNVLRAFQECDWDKLKVVILGQDPYPNERATGLAFANSDTVTTMSPALRHIHAQVEKDFYDGLKLDFDVTLESWAKQGVLLLNTALTVKKGIPGSHSKLWNPFTKEVLKTISEQKDDIVFMLWGNHAKSYSKFLDTDKHHVLDWMHPTAASYRGQQWNCPTFVKCNEILKNNNNEIIKW